MSPYPRRYRIWLGISLLHLTAVALGASYLGYSWAGPLAPALDYYGALSGAGSSYGFFAPGISSQLRATFEVIDKAGHRRPVELTTGASAEADLRVGNIIDEFASDAEDPVVFQRSLSSSLAGTVFGRNPDAARVAVKLENYKPVSMVEYRAGARGRWEPLYQATFAVAAGAGK